jgi:hypothetical protein
VITKPFCLSQTLSREYHNEIEINAESTEKIEREYKKDRLKSVEDQ